MTGQGGLCVDSAWLAKAGAIGQREGTAMRGTVTEGQSGYGASRHQPPAEGGHWRQRNGGQECGEQT